MGVWEGERRGSARHVLDTKVFYTFIPFANKNTRKHTHTHTERWRERMGARTKSV